MKAVILAAGKGTRMGELTRYIPKALIKVCGKPVIEHIIDRLSRSGVKDFVLVVGYLWESIRDYFGDGSKLGIHIEYAIQPSETYGTGSALLAARDAVGIEPMLVTFADVITSSSNYKNALEVFTINPDGGVIALNWVDDPYTGAAVNLDENGLVSCIIEKPKKGTVPSHWNSSGIFIYPSTIFNYLSKLSPSWRGEYELADAMNAMIADNLSYRPSYLKGMWKDVGRLEDIPVAEEMLSHESKV